MRVLRVRIAGESLNKYHDSISIMFYTDTLFFDWRLLGLGSLGLQSFFDPMSKAITKITTATRTNSLIDFRHFFKVGRSNFQQDSRDYKIDQLQERLDGFGGEFMDHVGRDVARFRLLIRSGKLIFMIRKAF